jgi:hypothetical protein
VDVDSLRSQLRDRGYLTHGIERWFALDPWSSRAFWLELATVALKAATLIALFGALPFVAVMLFRNHPLSVSETFVITVLYAAAGLGIAFAFLVAVALLFRLRPQLAVDTPRALLAISIAAAGLMTLPIAFWWYRFDAAPAAEELGIGIALIAIFFLVATIVVSAAMLSFSIYELQRVPALHQKPRGTAMSVAAAILIALLFLPAYAAQERTGEAPPQIVTTPTSRRVALIAVDGLTYDILHARRELTSGFAGVLPLTSIGSDSTAERWASVGTGVRTAHHGVRAIEGIRIRGGRHVLQSLSRVDFVLRDLAAVVGLARREPLPPTVRRRDYVWELFAGRGVTSASVNWWTTEDTGGAALTEVGQASVFAAATAALGAAEAKALRVDVTATRRLEDILNRDHPRFVTVYLPALDVVLNRLQLDPSTQLAASVNALENLHAIINDLRARRYAVIVAGLPGDRQHGAGVVASTFPLAGAQASPYDIAPTICRTLGFPLTDEMPGHSLIPEFTQPRIATYGNRTSTAQTVKVDEEYYEGLKSLGYIR